jgi:hypothetical protein
VSNCGYRAHGPVIWTRPISVDDAARAQSRQVLRSRFRRGACRLRPVSRDGAVGRPPPHGYHPCAGPHPTTPPLGRRFAASNPPGHRPHRHLDLPTTAGRPQRLMIAALSPIGVRSGASSASPRAHQHPLRSCVDPQCASGADNHILPSPPVQLGQPTAIRAAPGRRTCSGVAGRGLPGRAAIVWQNPPRPTHTVSLEHELLPPAGQSCVLAAHMGVAMAGQLESTSVPRTRRSPRWRIASRPSSSMRARARRPRWWRSPTAVSGWSASWLAARRS